MNDLHALTALYGEEICEFLGYYTVAMFFLGEDQSFDKAGIGSGVLVNLADKYFVLTAGHCAKDYRTDKTALGITRKEPHRFTPKIARINFRWDQERGVDFGYIEIPAVHKGVITSRAKLFMGQNRISVETSEQLCQDKDRMVVGGYPAEMIQQSPTTQHGTHGYEFFYNSAIIAGTGNASASTMPAAVPGMQTVDLSIPSENQVNTTSGKFEEMQIPRFRGMSGGGCWRSCVVPGVKWEPSHMKLVGVHVGTPADGRFAREVLIGHHLRLIAEDYPALQPSLYATWPGLRDEHWATAL